MKLKTRLQFNLGDLKWQDCPLSISFQFNKSQLSQQQGKWRRECHATPKSPCICGFNLDSNIMLKAFYVHIFLLLLTKLFVDIALPDANQTTYEYHRGNL